MDTFLVALRAVIYASAFITFFGWLALGLRSLDRRVGVELPAWTSVIGTIVMMLGGILVLTCLGKFIAKGRGTPAPFDPPQEFVATGPYKYVRNPMYIGGLSLLFGFGLYYQSVSILLFSLLLFPLFHLFVVSFEEDELEKRFGGSYLEYKNAVNRWIPKWKQI